jgi:acyl carrier protein
MPDIDKQIREIICVELQIDPERVVADARLSELGMDSVSALNILFAIEEAFGLDSIDVDKMPEIQTVRDLEAIVGRLIGAGGDSAER